MNATEISSLLTSLAALLAAGGWIANMGIKAADRRKTEAEARTLELDAGGAKTVRLFSFAEQTIDHLQEELTREREARSAFEKEMREREESCRSELRALKERLTQLEKGSGPTKKDPEP